MVPVGDAEVAIDLRDCAVDVGRTLPGGDRIGVAALVEQVVAETVGGDGIGAGLGERPPRIAISSRREGKK